MTDYEVTLRMKSGLAPKAVKMMVSNMVGIEEEDVEVEAVE